MTTLLYHLEVVSVGCFVMEYLNERKLILFADPVPQDIAQYCAVHRPGVLHSILLPGQILKINEDSYQITAVGDVATENLKQLGHITLNFDGAVTPELPGMVHVSGEAPRVIQPNDALYIYRE